MHKGDFFHKGLEDPVEAIQRFQMKLMVFGYNIDYNSKALTTQHSEVPNYTIILGLCYYMISQCPDETHSECLNETFSSNFNWLGGIGQTTLTATRQKEQCYTYESLREAFK